MNPLCKKCKEPCKQEEWVTILKCPDFNPKKNGQTKKKQINSISTLKNRLLEALTFQSNTKQYRKLKIA